MVGKARKAWIGDECGWWVDDEGVGRGLGGERLVRREVRKIFSSMGVDGLGLNEVDFQTL